MILSISTVPHTRYVVLAVSSSRLSVSTVRSLFNTCCTWATRVAALNASQLEVTSGLYWNFQWYSWRLCPLPLSFPLPFPRTPPHPTPPPPETSRVCNSRCRAVVIVICYTQRFQQNWLLASCGCSPTSTSDLADSSSGCSNLTKATSYPTSLMHTPLSNSTLVFARPASCG